MVLNRALRIWGEAQRGKRGEEKGKTAALHPINWFIGLAKRGWLTEENAGLIPTQHWVWVSPIIWSIEISVLESLRETDKGFTCEEQSSLDVWFQYFLNGMSVSFLYFWKERKRKLGGGHCFTSRPLGNVCFLRNHGRKTQQSACTRWSRDIFDGVHLSLLYTVYGYNWNSLFWKLRMECQSMCVVNVEFQAMDLFCPSYVEERSKNRKEKSIPRSKNSEKPISKIGSPERDSWAKAGSESPAVLWYPQCCWNPARCGHEEGLPEKSFGCRGRGGEKKYLVLFPPPPSVLPLPTGSPREERPEWWRLRCVQGWCFTVPSLK